MTTVFSLYEKIKSAIRAENSSDIGAIECMLVAKNPHIGRLFGRQSEVIEINSDLILADSIKIGGVKTHTDSQGIRTSFCGIAANKREACAFAVNGKYGRRSDDVPENKLGAGMSNLKGSICYDVELTESGGDGLCCDFLRIYVTVATFNENDDAKSITSISVTMAIKDWCEEVSKKSGLYLFLVENPIS